MLKEFRTVVPYLKKYKARYFAGIAFLIIVDGAQVLIPRFIKEAVDIVASGNFELSLIIRPALAMIGIAALISAGRYLWRYFIIGASRQIETELRDRLFGHLMGLSAGFYQANKTGDLMAKATNDMNAVRQSIGMAFVSFVDGVFMTSMIILAMIAGNPKVALLTLIPLPLVTVLILFFGKMVGGQFKKVQEVYSSMSDIAQETIAGMRVVRAFVKEGHFSGKFARTNDDYRSATMELVRTFGLFFPLISFLAGLSSAILLMAGGNAVLDNRMSPGDIIAMISYLEMLIWPLMGAGFTVNIIQRGAASMKRINEVLDTKSEIKVKDNARDSAPKANISIRNLDFSYPGAAKPALRGLNLDVPEGSTLGILGRVGSGKSTVLKLLPRLIDPGEGRIFIGGVDVCDLSLEGLRKTYGFVPQESFLFSDSVRSNILFGKPELGEARLLELARIASLERDLSLLPDGWNTVVGEKGLTLSGGQKQRVAIARALALDPAILVLDDALSAVDAETEEKILRNLLVERKGRTNVIVSHRVSTLRHADRILVLEGGLMTQLGSHDELIQVSDGFYAEIARLQELEAEVTLGQAPGGK